MYDEYHHSNSGCRKMLISIPIQLKTTINVYKLKTMKKFLLPLVLLFLVQMVHAQLGVHVGYRYNNAPDWKIVRSFDGEIEEFDILTEGLSFGVDVWFRLKNVRVEFLPELNYSQFSTDVETSEETIGLSSSFASLFVNTHIYFLDFFGDCNCPTFSKDGSTINKGIFLQVSPGLSYLTNTFDAENGKNTSSDFAFSIAAGLGIDIGISDLFTITPYGGLRYYPTVTWDNLNQITENYFLLDIKQEESTLVQPYFGIRLGFRFDKD